jgi:hypothetical protein
LQAADLIPGKCYETSDIKGDKHSGVCLQGGPAAQGRWQLNFMVGGGASFKFTEIPCNSDKAKDSILKEFQHQFNFPMDRNGTNGHITFAQALAAGVTKEGIITYFENIPKSDDWDAKQYAPEKIAEFLAPLKALAGGKRRKSHKRVKRNRKQRQRQQRSTRK